MTAREPAGPGVGAYTEAEAEFIRDWPLFCDADVYDPDNFTSRMETAGYIYLTKATRADVRDHSFAAELGIEIGGWIWKPTALGRSLLTPSPGARHG